MEHLIHENSKDPALIDNISVIYIISYGIQQYLSKYDLIRLSAVSRFFRRTWLPYLYDRRFFYRLKKPDYYSSSKTISELIWYFRHSQYLEYNDMEYIDFEEGEKIFCNILEEDQPQT